ncbi:MAG: hypothetical protein GKC04_04315 [Methanomicrobiales archaeon]|nr:hypothetical protein [Methanomicrobiales archaeon]
METITVEIIGFTDSPCGPFPCDDNRSCELEACAPTEKLLPACEALKNRLQELYGERVTVKITLLDNGVPEYVRAIIEEHQPPIPIVLINGKITPLGRISLPLLQRHLQPHLTA